MPQLGQLYKKEMIERHNRAFQQEHMPGGSIHFLPPCSFPPCSFSCYHYSLLQKAITGLIIKFHMFCINLY